VTKGKEAAVDSSYCSMCVRSGERDVTPGTGGLVGGSGAVIGLLCGLRSGPRGVSEASGYTYEPGLSASHTRGRC